MNANSFFPWPGFYRPKIETRSRQDYTFDPTFIIAKAVISENLRVMSAPSSFSDKYFTNLCRDAIQCAWHFVIENRVPAFLCALVGPALGAWLQWQFGAQSKDDMIRAIIGGGWGLLATLGLFAVVFFAHCFYIIPKRRLTSATTRIKELENALNALKQEHQNPLILALEELDKIYNEGDRLATLFQIPTAPRPTFSQVAEWDQKATAFVKRTIFEGRFTASDWELFRKEWSFADCQRIEKLLCRYRDLDKATDTQRATFRYIWGRVKRLNQLIAKIKGLETDENKTPIEILTDFQIRGQGLSDEMGSAEPQPPYAGVNELIDDIRRFLRKAAPNSVDRFNEAVENPDEPFGKWPDGLSPDELIAWTKDKRRSRTWDVLNSVSSYLNRVIGEFRSKLPS